MITKDMKISKLLAEYPQTLEVLVNFSPHFIKLNNKILRKTLASRVNVEQAAGIAGVNLVLLLNELNKSINAETQNIINEELKKQEEERIKAEQNRIAKEKANAELLVKLLLSNGFELGNNDSYIEPEYYTYSKGNYVVKYHELFLMKESDLLVSIGNVNTWIEQEQVRESELNAAKEEADRIRKELEAKQLAEENERLAKIAEQEEKEAAAKALLKAPDQEKVKAFFVQFTSLQFPELQSEAGKRMEANVKEALAIVKKVIIEDSKTLL